MKVKLTYVVILVMLASVLVYAQAMNQQFAYFLVAMLMVPLWLHLLVEANYRRQFVWFLSGSTWILLAFFLYMAIQVVHLFGGEGANELLFIGGYTYFFLGSFFLIPLIIDLDSRFDIRRLFVGIGVVLTGIALLGYVMGPIHLLGKDILTYRAYSLDLGTFPGVQSFLYSPNNYGSIVMIGLFSSLLLAAQAKSFLNKYIVYSGFLSIGFLFSFARSSYLGFTATVVLSFLTNKDLRKTWWRILLICTMISAILMVIGVDVFKWGRSFLRLDKANVRLDLWSASWRALLDRSLFGWGQRDLAALLAQYIRNPSSYGHGPHNTYLQLLLFGGIIGFAAYGFIYVSSLIKTYKLARRGISTAQWMFPLLGGLLVHSFFEARTPGGAGMVALVITVLLGWSQLLYIKTVTPGKRVNEINALQKNV